MQFLPENKKKTIWLVLILVLAVGVIVYVNFFLGKSNETPTGTASQTATGSAPMADTGLLPYGSKIDLHFLESDKFKFLRGIPKVTVSPEELGKDDLFSR